MNRELNKILVERQSLIILINNLEYRISSIDEEGIRKLLIKDKKINEGKLHEIDKLILNNGLPLFQEDTSLTFQKVNNELDKLSNSKELLDWIKLNCHQHYLNYITSIEKSNQEFNKKMTGKWRGTFYSKGEFELGEFSIGVCQIGSKFFGSGALIGSIYSNVFIKGLIDGDEVKVELLSLNEKVKTYFEGEYKLKNGISNINGNYYILDGLDSGTIISTLSKEVAIPLSEKTNHLILISNLKKKIERSNSQQLIEILDSIGETFTEHYNEAIIHKKRINTLSKNKRLNVISFSESQLEESKITFQILNLISQIENEVTNN